MESCGTSLVLLVHLNVERAGEQKYGGNTFVPLRCTVQYRLLFIVHLMAISSKIIEKYLKNFVVSRRRCQMNGLTTQMRIPMLRDLALDQIKLVRILIPKPKLHD